MKRIAVVLALALGLAGAARAEDAKTLFGQKCAPCHGPDGKAKRMGASDISGLKIPEAEIAKIVANGKGKMQPYKGKLSPEQIDGLAKYVKTSLK